MPEGHVTHRMAAAYGETFGGRPSRSTSPQGRFAQGAAIIDGRVLERAECFGKHLFCHFGADIVHIHRGMAGKTRLQRAEGGEDLGEEVTILAGEDATKRPVRGLVRWRIENDEAWLDLGSGEWDAARRPSEVRLDRVVRVDPAVVRREGAVLDRRRFDLVTRSLAAYRG